jgi:Short C-terminal domain
MRLLTPEGEQIIQDIASRHQVSVDAAKTMLEAVARGGGGMAQFTHPELGGSGQWLRGGMTMIGDMFNTSLKAKVDALASELSGLIANELQSGQIFASTQSQSQGSSGGWGQSSIFAQSAQSGDWWPADLGSPSSVGSQNDMRYAYFPSTRRLALYRNGQVQVLDTGEHIINGFGQQQGGGDAITLSSQLGTVPLSSLKRIELASEQAAERAEPPSFADTAPTPAAAEAKEANPNPGQPPSDAATILSLLEKLGELRDKSILSDDEFAAKKAELLKRL